MDYARGCLLWPPISLWKAFFRKDGDVELLGICKGGPSWDDEFFLRIGRSLRTAQCSEPFCVVHGFWPHENQIGRKAQG
jgi:hypothetical protein